MNNTTANLLKVLSEKYEENPKNWWQNFEIWKNDFIEWVVPKKGSLIKFIFNNPEYVRLKPETEKISGVGGCFKYPKPISYRPEFGQKIYVANPSDDDYFNQFNWKGFEIDVICLDNNVCHEYQKDAIQQTKAIVKALGGTVNE